LNCGLSFWLLDLIVSEWIHIDSWYRRHQFWITLLSTNHHLYLKTFCRHLSLLLTTYYLLRSNLATEEASQICNRLSGFPNTFRLTATNDMVYSHTSVRSHSHIYLYIGMNSRSADISTLFKGCLLLWLPSSIMVGHRIWWFYKWTGCENMFQLSWGYMIEVFHIILFSFCLSSIHTLHFTVGFAKENTVSAKSLWTPAEIMVNPGFK